MRIQPNSRNSFTGAMNNRFLLKGLECVSEHGTSFAAATSLLMSLGVRPLAIYSTPKVEKENKQYACSNSIASGLMKFAIVEAAALPIEYAVKKIDKNPAKYLKKPFISNSKSYKFATQILKLGTGFVTAIPKSMFTVALIPVIMDKLFIKKKNKETASKNLNLDKNGMSFTGKFSEAVPKTVGRLLDADWFRNFADKYRNSDKNLAKHITAATDILLTGASAYQIKYSSKIKEDRKSVLIYNNVISTGVTLAGGYAVDKAVKNKTALFIQKFSEANKGNLKLAKYIEGINIVRPAIIFASIYYGILPIFSTFFAERLDKFSRNYKNAK